MKILSRHLPPAPQPRTIWMDKAVRFLFLCVVSASILFWVYYHAVISLVIASVIAAVGTFLSFRNKTHFEKMMALRAGENICTFRRAFNLRQVDPWIVRAVYEELQDLMGFGLGKVSYPIRASDRLVEDLLVDPEELEDVANTVAARAGYDLTDFKQNPFYGKLQTVGDLVMFFDHQRKIRV